ncbi:multiple resistance and pH regulation protein F (MrpF / PhaF) superfamily [Wolbachia pipientis]|uniref:monovalent cation/H+ antiporter complex subunit F n=1 Tax=Wolbachia pipientis TaxID=955 RepID=UPI0015FD9FFE|nr:monovalent cation/H+ antiporter complex subunit F [Wolbachia pipientis]MBA8758451.1 multiple resistance and pH regulation protein F (MrpF / PhaF) superfamily [Wolbachia pipientis]MBA8770759.1 multiple resistance and pH regulation protein F (MrpF / PhaF) superfamily [Wolbachia pipientis]
MICIAIYTLLFCMSVMLCCIVSKSNDVYNKVLAFNNFSTQVVVLTTAISIILNNFFLIDIALLYASVSFISTIALMRLMLF